jgi:Restriction endonuclease
MAAPYRELEELVARIQRQLAPNATVVHDQRLPGRKSGRDRQIDVLVRDHIGQYEIQIVIDCKDYNKPADVKVVEEFYGLLDDVGAQKGVLVCPAGFSGTAKTRAEGLQIDLYSPVDTDPHKWQANPKIPAVCDFRSAAISFGISATAPYPLTLQPDFISSIVACSADGDELGVPLATAIEKWNSGKFPDAVGVHEEVPIYNQMEVFIDNGYGMKVPVNFFVGLEISQELFYGLFPITRIAGFRDEIRGGVITNAFELGILSPGEIERDWQRIEDASDAPLSPAMSLTGRVAWQV